MSIYLHTVPACNRRTDGRRRLYPSHAPPQLSMTKTISDIAWLNFLLKLRPLVFLRKQGMHLIFMFRYISTELHKTTVPVQIVDAFTLMSQISFQDLTDSDF